MARVRRKVVHAIQPHQQIVGERLVGPQVSAGLEPVQNRVKGLIAATRQQRVEQVAYLRSTRRRACPKQARGISPSMQAASGAAPLQERPHLVEEHQKGRPGPIRQARHAVPTAAMLRERLKRRRQYLGQLGLGKIRTHRSLLTPCVARF